MTSMPGLVLVCATWKTAIFNLVIFITLSNVCWSYRRGGLDYNSYFVDQKMEREMQTPQCICPMPPGDGSMVGNNLSNRNNVASWCEIPEHGPETIYTVYDPMDNELKSQPGVKVPKGSTLKIDCQKGFLHEDGRNSYLSTCGGVNKVFWNPPIQNCFKTCKPLKPRNVELICTFKGQLVNCSNPLLAGTEVQPSDCQPPFHQSFKPDYRTITCQEDGDWDNILFKCQPDCGKTHESEKLIFDGTPSTDGLSSPWNIAIYDVRHSPPILICGGTIVSPLMVVSAAHCFYAEAEQLKESVSNYKIVTGKIKRSYTSHDTDAQNAYAVRDILFSSDNEYHPAAKSYAADIAIVILRELIGFNFRVLPACIDWIAVHRFSPRKFKKGKIYGWGIDNSGLPSEVLKTADLPFISYNECLKKVTTLEFDKFCAGYDEGAGARKGDSGAGLVFENEADRLFYLRGIVSSRDKHSNSSVAKFTDLTFHIKWLDSIYREVEIEIATRPTAPTEIKPVTTAPPTEEIKPVCSLKPIWKDGVCEAPALSGDKNYTIRDSDNHEITVPPGTKIPEAYTLSFQCNDGFLLRDPSSGAESRTFFSRCQPAGLWSPPIRNCSKICEQIIPALHATLHCVYDNQPINCTNSMVAGTLVYSRCDPQYHYERSLNYSRMTCQENGKYDVVLGDCVPDCGRTSPQKLVFGGKHTEIGEDPWNVAIYNVHQSPPTLICSGTIVSPYMIITAAHCFGDEKTYKKSVATDYQIVVGKLLRNYSSTDTNWQKVYKVKQIRFADRGIYPLGYFAADIAVLITQEKIAFHRQISPACLDWRSTRIFNPGENTSGRFVAWGLEDSGKPSETLKAARLKFISLNECRRKLKNSEFDTFCAGSNHSSGLRKTDSGGGLIFVNPSDRALYLRGIMVAQSYDSSTSISKFTDISKYVEWLYEIYAMTSKV